MGLIQFLFSTHRHTGEETVAFGPTSSNRTTTNCVVDAARIHLGGKSRQVCHYLIRKAEGQKLLSASVAGSTRQKEWYCNSHHHHHKQSQLWASFVGHRAIASPIIIIISGIFFFFFSFLPLSFFFLLCNNHKAYQTIEIINLKLNLISLNHTPMIHATGTLPNHSKISKKERRGSKEILVIGKEYSVVSSGSKTNC